MSAQAMPGVGTLRVTGRLELLVAGGLVALAALVLLWPVPLVAPLDLWRGEALLHFHRVGRVVGAESFAAAGYGSGYAGWLGMVLVAALKAAGGGVATAVAAGTLFALALVATTVRTLRAHGRVGSVVAVAVALTIAAVAQKPTPVDCAGLALLAAALLALQRPERRRALLCIPIAFLWSNLDARGLFVPVLVLLFAAGGAIARGNVDAASRRLGLVALAALAAACVTPYGVDLVLRAAALLGFDPSYTELWEPAKIAPLAYWLALVPVYGAATLAGLWRRDRATDILIAAAALLLALSNGHDIMFAVAAVCPIVAARAARRLAIQPDAAHGILAAGIASTVIAGTFALAAASAPSHAERQATATASASSRLADGRPHRVACVPAGLCDTVVALGDPLISVLMDSRSTSYPAMVREDEVTIAKLAPGWAHRLRFWRIDALVVAGGTALSSVLSLSPDWRRANSGGDAVTFRRATAR